MGFSTRWDFMFDKAKKIRNSDDYEELLDSWSACIANAHKKFRAHLGAEETERFAEEQWWKFLCMQYFKLSGYSTLISYSSFVSIPKDSKGLAVRAQAN